MIVKTMIAIVAANTTARRAKANFPVGLAGIRPTDHAGGLTFMVLKNCQLCPRLCGVNRSAGQVGVCGATDRVRVARAALHAWEEPCISASVGSGTVFFSYCPLHCVYCQNHAIAAGDAGIEISVERLAQIYLELADQGAHNINLVTPTHYVPQIVASLALARGAGLTLPVVYNTSGYESVKTLDMLAGVVDVYLSDFKYADTTLAARYSSAPDYPAVAISALDAMVAQVGECVFEQPALGDGQDDEQPARLLRGVIVRHLMLPGCLDDSKAIVALLHKRYGAALRLSLMNQYTPVCPLPAYPELNARVPAADYEALLDFADDLGVQDYYWQEGGAAEESFIPVFNGQGVAGSELPSLE
ncbi:MAG: radical SAM protein [Raoultibacter sp.]